MTSAYVRKLMESVEIEHAKHEEQARAEAQAVRDRLVPLHVRLSKCLAEIPDEVKAEGLSLEALRKMLRGAKGRGAHCAAVADSLRAMKWRRVRRWDKSEDGFRVLWFPPS